MCRSDCVVCCITGFVREKEIIPFKKGHYDKITKTSTAGKQEAKRVLEFASFTLFYLNEYGLIGGSEEELAAVSELILRTFPQKNAVSPIFALRVSTSELLIEIGAPSRSSY